MDNRAFALEIDEREFDAQSVKPKTKHGSAAGFCFEENEE